MTVNLSAVILTSIGSLFLMKSPMTATQMLWVNMIMDSLGSLALATETPHEGLLDRAPAKKNEFMVSSKMQKHVVGQALYQLIVLFVFLFAGPTFILETDSNMQLYGWGLSYCFNGPVTVSPAVNYTTLPLNPDNYLANKSPDVYLISGLVNGFSNNTEIVSAANATWCTNLFGGNNDLADAYNYVLNQQFSTTHYTVIFNTFVFMQLMNQICCRIIDDDYNIFFRISTNYMFFVIFLIEAASQVIIVMVTGPVFKVVYKGLGGYHWGICIGFSVITFVINILLKFCPDMNFACDENSGDKSVEQSFAGNIKGNSKIKQASLPGNRGSQKRGSLRKEGSKNQPKQEGDKQPSMKGDHVKLSVVGNENQA